MREIKFRVWDGSHMNDVAKTNYVVQTGFIDRDANHEKNIWLQYTGLEDKNGFEVYEGDIIEVEKQFSKEKYLCIVKFGKYKQDGSGGEYSPVKIVGFYADALPNQLDEDGDPLLYDFDLVNSLLGIGDFKVVGNIYVNPELLDR